MIWRIVFKRTSILGGWWFGVMCTRWSSTFPKHPFCQMSVLLIVHFFKSSCCQILVRHLQRRPFPSLLSDSSFMFKYMRTWCFCQQSIIYIAVFLRKLICKWEYWWKIYIFGLFLCKGRHPYSIKFLPLADATQQVNISQ